MSRTLKDIGELGLLKALEPVLARHTEGLPLPTGDDCAVTDTGGARLVWTIDSMIENTHFRWYNHPMATAANFARKLVAANVSDLASKGARPLYGLLSFGAPGSADADHAEAFIRTLGESLEEYGGRLIGGDTVRAPQWSVTLALVGEISRDASIPRRSLARPGRRLYVTGTPGESAAGLAILEGSLRIDEPHGSRLVGRCVAPTARLATGLALVERFADLAMIDVSDGVARDAARIAAASGVGIVIEARKLPYSESLLAARSRHLDPRELLLYGGEDFELLFCTAASEEEVRAAAGECPVTCIGQVIDGEGVQLEEEDGARKPLQIDGFEHF